MLFVGLVVVVWLLLKRTRWLPGRRSPLLRHCGCARPPHCALTLRLTLGPAVPGDHHQWVVEKQATFAAIDILHLIFIDPDYLFRCDPGDVGLARRLTPRRGA